LYRINERVNRLNARKRKSGMPRPPKIREDTKTYNLLMPTRQYDILSVHSSRMTEAGLEQVAVADLIREAIDVYIEALEDEEYEGSVTEKN
jgi:predicted DNA-binding protein